MSSPSSSVAGSVPTPLGLFHAIEKVVLECRFRRDPSGRIVLEHPVEEVYAFHVEGGNQTRQSPPWWRVGGEPVGTVLGQFHNAGKVPGGLRGSQEPKDPVQLVVLGSPRHQWPAVGHLGKDAPDAPNVNGGRVFAGSQQYVGRPVPQRHDLVGVGPHGNPKGSGQTKVGQLELSLPIDEQVGGFQIAVQDPVVMAVGNARQ